MVALDIYNLALLGFLPEQVLMLGDHFLLFHDNLFLWLFLRHLAECFRLPKLGLILWVLEVTQQILGNFILVLDVKDLVELLVCPEEVLMDLEHSQERQMLEAALFDILVGSALLECLSDHPDIA